MAEVIDLKQAARRAADDALISSVLNGNGADVANVATVFYETLETIDDDDEARFLALLQIFYDGDGQYRAAINVTLQTLCGYGLADLIRIAASKDPAADKWASAGAED